MQSFIAPSNDPCAFWWVAGAQLAKSGSSTFSKGREGEGRHIDWFTGGVLTLMKRLVDMFICVSCLPCQTRALPDTLLPRPRLPISWSSCFIIFHSSPPPPSPPRLLFSLFFWLSYYTRQLVARVVRFSAFFPSRHGGREQGTGKEASTVPVLKKIPSHGKGFSLRSPPPLCRSYSLCGANLLHPPPFFGPVTKPCLYWISNNWHLRGTASFGKQHLSLP